MKWGRILSNFHRWILFGWWVGQMKEEGEEEGRRGIRRPEQRYCCSTETSDDTVKNAKKRS